MKHLKHLLINGNAEKAMKKEQNFFEDHRKSIRLYSSLVALTTALLCNHNSIAFAETEFQGSLNSVSISDVEGTNIPPTAVITFSEDQGVVTFDASSSSDSDGSITKYSWDFGDGTTGTGITATHQYQAEEVYPVTLTVQDDGNGIALSQVQYDPRKCTQTIMNSVSNSASYVIYSTSNKETVGQSFIGNGQQLCSVTVRTYSKVGDPSTSLVARVGTSADLSTQFSEADSVIVPSTVGADMTFEWGDGPILEAGVVYFFMIHNLGTTWNSRVDLQLTDTSTYPGGKAQAGVDWVTSDYSSVSRDLSFEIGTK